MKTRNPFFVLRKNTESDYFYKVYTEVLNQHAPRKALSKAIMLRTKLRNKFLKDPSTENKFSYNKQRNWCVSLLRKEKKKYFANLNEEDITDNKNFWQTTKPFLSEKTKSRGKITLIENENLVSDYAEVANCLGNFFST